MSTKLVLVTSVDGEPMGKAVAKPREQLLCSFELSLNNARDIKLGAK